MTSRLSTSSSDRLRRLPIAGLLAALLLLAVDALAFRVFSPWSALRTHTDHWFYSALVKDRLVVDRIERDPRDQPSALLMGSSRLAQAWEPKRLDPPVPESLRIYSIKHASIYPAVMRAAAEAIGDRAPDVVVLGLSEVDTHGPLELGQRTAFPNPKLYLEAARDLGPRWLFAERRGLYRYAFGDVVSGYSHRKIVGAAGFDRLRRFRLPRDHPARIFPADPTEERIVSELTDAGVYEPDRRELDRALRFQIGELSEVRFGPHAQVQMQFVRRAVEIFRAAGSEVILFELPVAPAAKQLYDPAIRAEFLGWAATLERDLGVRVIRLEEHRSFEPRDFTDLTHLERGRATEITRAMLAAILAAGPNPGPGS